MSKTLVFNTVRYINILQTLIFAWHDSIPLINQSIRPAKDKEFEYPLKNKKMKNNNNTKNPLVVHNLWAIERVLKETRISIVHDSMEFISSMSN